ncbi:MAG: enoyl-CoA hydratase-related protein [Candidatus Kapaibacterium sp.]
MTTLLVEKDNGIMHIRLNRPDVYNACNNVMTTELLQAFREAEADDEVRCVVLGGSGRAFCSGQDLKEAPGSEGQGTLREALETRYNPIIRAMTTLPKPIIAAINGVAAGAGLSLALAADVRVMSSSAKLVEAFSAIALVPDSGATFFYARMLGYPQAFEFATRNGQFSAEQAMRVGMVNMVVSPEALDAAVTSLAREYASGPTKSYGYIKWLLRQAQNCSLDEMLDHESDYQQRAGETLDYEEGVRAFQEKRRPVFTGR